MRCRIAFEYGVEFQISLFIKHTKGGAYYGELRTTVDGVAGVLLFRFQTLELALEALLLFFEALTLFVHVDKLCEWYEAGGVSYYERDALLVYALVIRLNLYGVCVAECLIE